MGKARYGHECVIALLKKVATDPRHHCCTVAFFQMSQRCDQFHFWRLSVAALGVRFICLVWIYFLS